MTFNVILGIAIELSIIQLDLHLKLLLDITLTEYT